MLAAMQRATPIVLEGSFDFFKVFPSNALALPTILQQSLLGRLRMSLWLQFSKMWNKGNQKTFRPKKNAPSGSKGAQLQKHIDATLGSGNLREAVRLPLDQNFRIHERTSKKYMHDCKI